MSGHSKWASIKRQKAGTDAKRGQMFSKIGRANSLEYPFENMIIPEKAGPRQRQTEKDLLETTGLVYFGLIWPHLGE